MQIETTRFGQIEVEEESVLRFPRGLYGLETRHFYCLRRHDEAGCFHWLQSTEEPALAMLVTDPFRFFHSYEVEIPDSAAEMLQVTTPSEVATYVTVTLAENGRQLNANLLGPLLINLKAGLGAQLIQDSARYSTRHLIGESATEGEKKDAAAKRGGETRGPGQAADAAAGRSRSGRFRPLTVPM